MFKFKASDLPEILTRWSARYSVFVPSGSPDNAQMRIWSRRTRKEVRFMEPDEYTNLIVAPKGFVFGEREELFRWEGNEKTCTAISAPSSSSLQEEDKILFGLRPCDTYGLAYMDRFFLGEHHDINYHLRRQHVFIVAVNCLEAGPECYCASMGTGPFAEITAHTEYGMQAGKGYDLLLTPDYGPDHKKGEKGENDWYWVEAGSDRGKALLSHVAPLLYRDLEFTGRRRKKALQEDALKTFRRTLDTSTVRQVLAAHFKDEEWDAIASSCIACTGCTRVCPTCTCFTTEEEQDTPHSGTRVRVWDSCQSVSFTRNAEFHNPRSKTSAVRYRIYDKLQYIEERFGMKGCTGCGRCAAVCPASIDMVDIMARMKERTPHEVLEAPAPAVNVHYEREERLFDPQPYTPLVAEIIDIFEEAKGIKRFTVRYRDPPQSRPPRPARPVLHADRVRRGGNRHFRAVQRPREGCLHLLRQKGRQGHHGHAQPEGRGHDGPARAVRRAPALRDAEGTRSAGRRLRRGPCARARNAGPGHRKQAGLRAHRHYGERFDL